MANIKEFEYSKKMSVDLDDKANLFENTLKEFFLHMSKFQYDKAKTSIEKSKDSNRIWSMLQNTLLFLIEGEKSYYNLYFLNQKSISKIGDKYFEPAISILEQLNKEILANNSQMNNDVKSGVFEISNLADLVNGLMQFIELRFSMMNLYFEMKERELRGTEKNNIENILNQLVDIEQRYKRTLNHSTSIQLKYVVNLETSLLYNILKCHLAMHSKLDCISALVLIKEINDLFNTKLPLFNNKLTKESKGFSLFSRSSIQTRTIPALFQWFKLYHNALLNKFSLIMYNSFEMINQTNHIMNEKIDVYNKILNFYKKFNCSLIGIFHDTNANAFTLINFKGNGYEMGISSASDLSASSRSTQTTIANDGANQTYPPLIFSYPTFGDESSLKHFRNLLHLNSSEADQKVKYYFDANLKSSYYLTKVSETCVLFIVYEQNKQENKTKAVSFIQEISDELNFTNVFLCFNTNLK